MPALCPRAHQISRRRVRLRPLDRVDRCGVEFPVNSTRDAYPGNARGGAETTHAAIDSTLLETHGIAACSTNRRGHSRARSTAR